jgi:hypothetical protein
LPVHDGIPDEALGNESLMDTAMSMTVLHNLPSERRTSEQGESYWISLVIAVMGLYIWALSASGLLVDCEANMRNAVMR